MDRKAPAKVLLTRVGSICGARAIYNLNGVFNYLHVGWWLRAHGFRPDARVRSRAQLFRHIATEIAERNVLYLEFGVAKGASIRQWSELLRNPDSALHGFDSFRGLPHDWSLEGHERGHFSTGGRPPEIADPRVQFFVGWFEDTLPDYRWPEHDVLVVVMDADLYTSTSTALQHVKDRLVPGSYLYFDQFHHRCDELRHLPSCSTRIGSRSSSWPQAATSRWWRSSVSRSHDALGQARARAGAVLQRAPNRATRNAGERFVRITFNEGWAGVDLAEYFRRSDCLVDQIGRHVVEVNPRQPLLPGAAKLEIEGLLRVWCKLHPGAITTVLPVEQARPLAEPDVLTT